MKAEFAPFIRTVQLIPKSSGNKLGVGKIFLLITVVATCYYGLPHSCNFFTLYYVSSCHLPICHFLQMMLGILCSVVLTIVTLMSLYSKSIIYCFIGLVNVIVKNVEASEYVYVLRLVIFQYI